MPNEWPLELTPREFELLLRSMKIAAEDGSIYGGATTEAEIEKISDEIEKLDDKLRRARLASIR